MIRFPTARPHAPGHVPSCRKGTSLEEAIAKADTLIEALGWIRQFRDKVTVIKLGGSVMEDDDGAAARADRHRLHGNGRHAAGRRPRRRSGDQPRHGGGGHRSRVSSRDAATPTTRRWRSSNRCLAAETNERLASQIEDYGGRAMNLNFRTTNVLFGEPIALPGENGEPIDLGYVGHVTRVDRTVIDNLCYAGQVPVIPSMCIDASGQK